ncbi:glycosyltransferase, partial [Aliarcobacter skirrowii]|uniref:glycosyltransferase n=1 Tax=Aliarcobacter skirrowii TaxID=28200 RepID=UPI0029BC647A
EKVLIDEFDILYENLKEKINQDFPKRYDKLNFNYLYCYKEVIKKYKKLFEEYDVVIGYGLEGIYPLLAGKKFIAFEHGTLRNFPFQNDDLGLRALLSYKYANGVIITNADNIQAAKKLGLKNYLFIPHPINESPLKLLSSMDYDNLYEKYNTDFIAFHPSRQHWERDIRHPDWEKGNDIFIEGFAKFVKEVNPKAKSIFIEWGQKVCDSKELISHLGIEENIIWIKPLHNYAMIRVILSSDVVADQFYLGAFGSTTPKALMCGKPAMLYLDESLHEWCFDEMPPVLNTAKSEDVFSGLSKLYNDKNFAKKVSFESKNWYIKYHSNELIKEKLVEMIHKVLNSNEV